MNVNPVRMSLSIAVEPPRQPEVEELLEQSTRFALGLYPSDSCFLLDVAELERPSVALYAARGDEGRIAGIAALVAPSGPQPGDAELKRMFVSEAARGLGVAGALLRRIEADAAERGLNRLVLETGTRHEAALALYARHGYGRIPLFGDYVGEEFSICLAKDLEHP